MLNKPAALTLMAAAVFAITAWSMGMTDIHAACAIPATSPDERPGIPKGIRGGQALDSDGDGSGGFAQAFRIPYDMLDESRLH